MTSNAIQSLDAKSRNMRFCSILSIWINITAEAKWDYPS